MDKLKINKAIAKLYVTGFDEEAGILTTLANHWIKTGDTDTALANIQRRAAAVKARTTRALAKRKKTWQQ
jgi:hypothetical protein